MKSRLLVIVVALALALMACAAKPVKSVSGQKIKRVVAEYWPKSAVGYSIKLTFPENPNDADRGEISDVLEDFGCSTYEGGGSPGAPQYMTCEGVKDDSSADKKLAELLPALEDLMARISRNEEIKPSARTKAREAAKPKTMKEWIAKVNAKKEHCKGDGWQGGGTNGYDSWTESCVKGIIVYTDTTEEYQHRQAEENAHKYALANALVSRCLTAKEFAEVTQMGYSLYTTNMVPYQEADVQSRFNAALQTQQILRMNCPVAVSEVQ